MTQKEISWLTNQQIAEKLDLYNHWRRGDCPFEEPGCNPPMEPKELGLLIDEAVLRLNMKQKETFNDEAFS